MLLDIVIQSVNEFQADCLKICEKHYPTIHNQGMTEHHLGLAFSRRLARTLTEFGHSCEYVPIELKVHKELPRHFRVTSDMGTVWILTNHIMSAGPTCRDNIMKNIMFWREEFAYAIQPSDLLLLISDHWISRAAKSRALLHWWMGTLPDELEAYTAQGICLYESDSVMSQTLDKYFKTTPCFMKYAHPLINTVNKHAVKKYMQLYAVLQWA